MELSEETETWIRFAMLFLDREEYPIDTDRHINKSISKLMNKIVLNMMHVSNFVDRYIEYQKLIKE